MALSNSPEIKFAAICLLVILVVTFGRIDVLLAQTPINQPTSVTPHSVMIPSNFSFQRDLSLGQTYSPDILYLQKFLNQDARTRLAETAPCSLDPLTNTFDTRTRDAVMRFQNLYKAEILTPVGVTAPTGIVGATTRAKINQLLKTYAYKDIIAAAPTTATPATNAQALTEYYNSVNAYVKSGGTVTPQPSTTTTATSNSAQAQLITKYFNSVNSAAGTGLANINPSIASTQTAIAASASSSPIFVTADKEAVARGETVSFTARINDAAVGMLDLKITSQSGSVLKTWRQYVPAGARPQYIRFPVTIGTTTPLGTLIFEASQNGNSTVKHTASTVVSASPSAPATTYTTASGAQPNPTIKNYYNAVNQVVSGAQPNLVSAINAVNGTQTKPATTTLNPAIANYYNAVNQAVKTGTLNTVQTFTASSTAIKPILESVSPLIVSNCDQQIILTGYNFATSTKNTLVSNIGNQSVSTAYFATSTGSTTNPTANTSLGYITFTLRQFSEFAAAQNLHSGNTLEITIRVASNNAMSDQIATLRFTFPGTRRYIPLGNDQQMQQPAPEAPEAPMSGSTPANGSNGNTSNSSSNNSSGGQLQKTADMEKKLLSYTPHGKIIKMIGGEEALDTFYSFTPTGHLNEKLQGNSTGAISLSGKSFGGGIGGGGQSGGQNGGGGNMSGAAGVLGIGALAIGGSALLGGGGAAAGAGAAGAGAGAGAAAASPFLNFGGKIITNFPCTCSGNLLLTIQDVRGPTWQLIFQPGASILYMNYNLTPATNVLGDFVGGGVCLVYVAVGCSPYGAPMGTIKQIGTSVK